MALAHDTHVTIKGSAQVKGSVYGGSESGFVQNDTDVKIQGDCQILTTTDTNNKVIEGNVFGGGKGVEVFAEAGKVKGNTTVAISGGTTNGNVYGGGELGDVGTINKEDPKKNYKWANELGLLGDDYTYNNTGVCNVSVTDAAATIKGHVFGAGKGLATTFWCEKAMAYKTIVTISAGKVEKNVYGGGEIGRVEYDTQVKIGDDAGSNKPEIYGSVFGAGAGVVTHGYSALVRNNTTVTIQAKTEIGKSVYGGGEIASVGKYGLDAKEMPSILKGGGICTVTVKGEAKVGVKEGGGNVFGAGQGIDIASVTGDHKRMTVSGGVSTWETFASDAAGVAAYKTFLETLGLATAPTVTIEGSVNVNGSVYGGGEVGITKGAVVVEIKGGTIEENVYGGGALADTNTGNWSPNKYVEATGLSTGDPATGYYIRTGEGTDADPYVYTAITAADAVVEAGKTYCTTVAAWTDETKKTALHTTAVRLTGGHIKGDAYGGGLGDADHAPAVYGDVLVELNGKTTKNSSNVDELTLVPRGSTGCKVYQLFGGNDANGSPKGNVTVHVYGTQHPDKTKINEKYNPPLCEAEKDKSEGYKAWLQRLIDTAYKKDTDGNVITPRTKVTGLSDAAETAITNAETALNGITTAEASLSNEQKTIIQTHVGNITQAYKGMYDVYAVYGGGDNAPYEPMEPNTSTDLSTPNGARSQVIIEGCDYTSIQYVYGGSNAAPVPETYVLIKGSKVIDYLFGGGNGTVVPANIGYKKNGTDQGTGNVTIQLMAGYIHNLYGASNSNGNIRGTIKRENVSIPTTHGDECCNEMLINNIYTAGKNADVGGDMIDILCMAGGQVDEYYGGAKNANVKGKVELTITGGKFKKVFGGNKTSGSIFGHIKLNIEETGNCNPIEIDELYLCGNDAAYSMYGYYVKTSSTVADKQLKGDPDDAEEEADLNDGKLIFLPRESMNDPHWPVKDYWFDDTTDPNNPKWKWSVYKGTSAAGDTFEGYDPPELNVVSATRIGKVYGGGLGSNAKVYGDPKVNINMIQGNNHANVSSTNNPNQLCVIGDVYGGGDAANVYGTTNVNIGTKEKVNLHQSVTSAGVYTMSGDNTVLGAYITGNVYGGGNLADVGKYDVVNDHVDMTGHTNVNICAKYDEGTEKYVAVPFAAANVTIGGNVFGGGAGSTGTFKCEKAMVTGETNVRIGNGTVAGTVYGGGEIARVETNTHVTVGYGDGATTATVTSAPIINGDVFGAGAGANTHGYAALVRGNTNVTVEGRAKIGQNIYGGGEIASVGKYKVKKGQNDPEGAPDDVEVGMPYTTHDGGICTVIVKGYAEVGPDDMQMKKAGGPDDTGYVFGAGKGILPYEKLGTDNIPKRMTFDSNGDYYEEYTYAWYNGSGATDHPDPNRGTDYVANYLKYIETLALSTTTYVTIGEHAFIKGSVYGGSENGHVQANTNVTIQENCQIGNGWDEAQSKGVNVRYDEALFIDPTSATPAQIAASAAELKECAHWDYGHNKGTAQNPVMEYLPYDKYVTSTEGATTASDGHTFYGNVFGGGSGLYPYKKPDNTYEWLRSAGRVYGNTNVTINGGHILTSVYGGCELTDVGNGTSVETGKGKCTITMTDGTIGVPRTLDSIAAHPVVCNLFGAGKGDQRVRFNQWTNVGSVKIEVSGGKIYGSIFGGGEDGHVLGDVDMDITGGTIGTWGTSYMEGNVFGGGRGFGGDALTAGVVCGNVDIDMTGGKILGSVYGGGRLGSVGTYLVPATHAKYGTLIEDGKKVTITDGDVSETTGGGNHGHVTIDISGGTIGNNREYKYYTFDVDTDGKSIAQIDAARDNWLKTQTAADYIPNTEFEIYDSIQTNTTRTYYARLSHTKGGNVFAGSMGRLYGLDGSVLGHWLNLGKAKSTKLTISNEAVIKSCVYGGGELGPVSGSHKDADNNDVATEIIFSGGTIGTEVKDASDVTLYGFGSIFGGGYGSTIEELKDKDNHVTKPKLDAGKVTGNTSVSMSGTVASSKVKASVYGGGEVASVVGNTNVAISGGEIGMPGMGGVTMGNVYGGGKGNRDIVRAGLITGNTTVNISGSATSPRIYHNVYGGGAYGSVGVYTYDYTYNAPGYIGKEKVSDVTGRESGGETHVTITGGTIGINGNENGMVFGSSRGDVDKPGERDDFLAWTYDTHVTIGTSGQGTTLDNPHIMGSVYGSGENGHNYNDTEIYIHSGTVGISSGSPITGSSGKTYNGAEYPYRGNVYGGGCGTDLYDSDDDGVLDAYNPLSGIVYGTTSVNVTGGLVVRNIYGAGAMGSVGKTNATGAIISGGTTAIAISGGYVGVDGTKGDGNVYGAARGDFTNTQTHLSQVRSTNVSMSDGTVWGNLYGGGEAGDVGTYVKSADGKSYIWDKISDKEIGSCTVEITGGTVKGDVYGAGKGEANTFECEKAMVRATSVTVSAGTVEKNVYGGGEVGRVDQNAVVTIGSGSGTEGGDAAPLIVGSVFGAGAGKETHGYSALVRGNTEVIVEGNAKVQKSVFGGGEIAAVGRYGLDAAGMPSTLVSGGECKVIVRGYAEIGPDNGGGVFGAGEGVVPHYVKEDPDDSKRSRRMDNNGDWEYFDTEAKYMNFLQTLALATDTKLSVGGNAKVYGSVYGGSKSGFVQRYTNVTIQDDCKILPTTGTDDGNVFGGGKGLTGNDDAGRVRGDVMVSILGGTTSGTVYGGAALAKSNAFVDNGVPTTTVNLFGGTIEGDVFGGGLGNATTKADVGNTQVNLNGMTTEELNALSDATLKTQLTTILTGIKEYTRKGCVVKGNVFGANNVNGTPKGHVLVHVHGTQNKDKDMNTIKDKIEVNSANVNNQNSYDVIGVFGGGKQSDYLPDDTDAKQSTEVIIEGCDLTSIYEVYGGGYGAATPAANVLIKGTKIINNVFGGGFGANTTDFPNNPGANIGYYTNSSKDSDNPDYPSATGKAIVQLMAGTINHVYGGSNTKGDIRGGSSVTSVERGAGAAGTGEACCDKMTILDIFGGGKSAPMFGGAEIILGCMPNDWIGAIYGGAEAADVHNDVSLTLTSGKFGRVFGGNKSSGIINGSIEVNIEENPNCDTPIIIGELYGGGDMAPYTTPSDYFTTYPNYQSPRVNVRAFTSIGNIFGGGYGTNATVTGNPLVNINEIEGGRAYAGEEKTLEDGTKVTLYERKADGKMGVIGNVFGGGNAAPVIGQTFVNIGTATKQKMLSLQTKDASGNIIEVEKDVLGADIRGNVYGGGNNAEVSGKTNVVIGQEK